MPETGTGHLNGLSRVKKKHTSSSGTLPVQPGALLSEPPVIAPHDHHVLVASVLVLLCGGCGQRGTDESHWLV